MRLRRLKKFAPHLIIFTALIATVVPTLGSQIISDLTPYLRLTSVLSKPEAVELEGMRIVDKKFEKDTVEFLNSYNPTRIDVEHNIWDIEGIYLQSEYAIYGKNSKNYYNSLVRVNEKIIRLENSPLPGSGQIPVVVEYTIREWTEITWLLDLKFDNRGDDTIIVPRANLTLNYLDDNLAKGWIGREYEIKGHERKIVEAYLVMKNDRFTETFINAFLLGIQLDLTLGFEAYILAEGQNGEPLLPIIYGIEMDFVLPGQSRGPPPFIHSITRAPVSANQPVKISVGGSDEGTGISNSTYIYYSIDGGASWDTALLKGPAWWSEYVGTLFPGSFPISSTLQEETYEGEIPPFPAGTQVLFKVYLEDYAANVDHVDKGNWVWSQTYSYVVPGSGELPEFTQKFNKIDEKSSTQRFMDYLELNGVSIDHFQKTRGIISDTYMANIDQISKFLYEHDVDEIYGIGMLLVYTNKASELLADSGVATGYLLDLLGVSFKDFFAYIVENIFLPTKGDATLLVENARDRFSEITVIDDIEGSIPEWSSSPSGTVVDEGSNRVKINGERIPNEDGKSLLWTLSAPANLSGDFSSAPRDLSKNDLVSFYIDYDNYTTLNGNLSVTLLDNNGREMTSKQISFEETAPTTWQEITLHLNEFTQDTGFNLGAIYQMNFTYNGTEGVGVYIDYIFGYSASSYDIHQYITHGRKVGTATGGQVKMTRFFGGSPMGPLAAIYQGSGMVTTPVETADPIIPDFSVDLGEMRRGRTSGWNFINLVATNGTYEYDYGKAPNHHVIGAATFLEYLGDRIPHERLCELFGVEMDEFDVEPFTAEEIYPYTQTLGALMVYIPLGAVAALAIILQVRRYRTRKKVEKIKKKYTKIKSR
ncbi:MAG: hypothetical protein ACFE8A_08050 [Candidatus Hodarchaeota archaeon]